VGERHKRWTGSVPNKTKQKINKKKLEIKTVKKEETINPHSVGGHRKKALVLTVKMVIYSMGFAVAEGARGRGRASVSVQWLSVQKGQQAD
jgi:hypothetical protein